MGKRSDFPRRERDFYPTPAEAVVPLLDHLPDSCFFDEPCAGNGALVTHFQQHGHFCIWMSDIEPQVQGIRQRDVMSITKCHGSMFITNPPWPAGAAAKGEPTVSMAIHLSNIAPTWFLLSSDFAHNKYFGRLQPRCSKIVSVGRVSWMGNGKAGVDNASWYRFNADNTKQTEFYGRSE